jgi:ABC-type branched-subunit amino acid transport system substrate-binding protein
MSRRVSRSRAFLSIAVVALSSLLIAACSSSSGKSAGGSTSASSGGSSGSAATTTQTVAVIADMTGAYAALSGQSEVSSIQAAFDAQNAKGGTNGVEYKTKTYDTQSSSAGGVAAVRDALNDKPFAIVTNSSFIGSAINTLVQSGVPVFGDGDLPNFPGPGHTNLFGLNGNLGTRNTTAWAQYCTANGRNKFAIPGSTIPGVSLYQAVWEKVSTGAGGTVVYSKIGIDSSNSATIQQTAQQIISSGANCVISLLIPGSGQLQVAINQLGGNVWVLDPQDFGAQIEQQFGTSASGLQYFGYTAPLDLTSNPGVAEYLADMKKYAPSQDPRGNWVEGWEAAKYLMYVTGLVKGTLTQASLITAGGTVTGYTVDGMHGPISNPGYQNGSANELCGGFEVLKDGKYVPVTTAPANKEGFVCGTAIATG